MSTEDNKVPAVVEIEISANEVLQQYKQELQIIHDKSQEAFEKQLTYLSSGALGLSILFIEKIVVDVSQSQFKPLLITSWIALACTLVVNLISHYKSHRSVYKTIGEINDNKYDQSLADNRNRMVNYLNISTIITFCLGILLLVLFVIINTMSKEQKVNLPVENQRGYSGGPAPSVNRPEPNAGQIPTPPPTNITPKAIPPKSK